MSLHNIQPTPDANFFGDDSPIGMTVARYAEIKALPEKYLRDTFKLTDSTNHGNPAMVIPYFDESGQPFRSKMRRTTDSHSMFWLDQSPEGAPKTLPYGLWLVKAGSTYLIVVEGESDLQTLRYHNFSAIGISGASGWDDAFAEMQAFKRPKKIIVIQEPGEGGERFVKRLAQSPLQPKLFVVSLGQFKDASEMHLYDADGFNGNLKEILNAAVKVPAVPKPTRTKASDALLESRAVDIETMMDQAQIAVRSCEDYQGGWRWILEECVFTDHPKKSDNDTSAAVILFSSGLMIYSCVHKNSCPANTESTPEHTPWDMFREYCEAQIGYKMQFTTEEDAELAAVATAQAVEPTILSESTVAVAKAEETAAQVQIVAKPTVFSVTFPADIAKPALQGIIGEFVNVALPYSEADVNCLTYQALVALGNVLGRRNYVPFGAERHYPNLFLMTIGTTSSGKGQGYHAVNEFAKAIDKNWTYNQWKYSAASGEGLVKLLANEPADNRLLLMLTEMSILLNSMRREGSNLSGYLRAGYDGDPLQNNKARESLRADNYLLSSMSLITPRELTEIMAQVDWYNGVANRFLWNIVQRSKTLTRSTTIPDFTNVAERVKAILMLPTVGAIDFSPAGAKMWDDWCYSLPFNDDSKLGASQERVRPNALRTALIYASLDENRLNCVKNTGDSMLLEIEGDGRFWLEPKHIEAAIAVVERSKASVEWFLNQPMMTLERDADFPAVKKVLTAYEQAVVEGRPFTGSDLCRVLSNTSASERSRIAREAGLTMEPVEAGQTGGRKVTVWKRIG